LKVIILILYCNKYLNTLITKVNKQK